MNILLTTFGSLGDLHPYIAVGLGLRARGHDVTIATSAVYRPKVEGEGLSFHPVQPDVAGLISDLSLMNKAYHPRTGGEFIMREVFLPHIAAGYADLLPAAREADLLISHPLAFATPMVAEVLGKPWVAVILQPALLISAWDPPSISGYPFLEHFRAFGPGFWRLFWRLGKSMIRKWAQPAIELRARLGLPELQDPILSGMFSPFANQAWFSRIMASPQPDWPDHLEVTGFPFYDKLEPGKGLSAELDRFLKDGPAPVVFTLGSSAVFDAGPFYEESAKAARALGLRAVLLVGTDPRNRPRQTDPNLFFAEYAPFSELFPRAAAIVHQGGSGTTAQALRSGKPMIFVPYSHDQPDNARRVANLGAARVIPRHLYRADRIVTELRRIIDQPEVGDASRRLAAALFEEDGIRSVCEGIERVFEEFRAATSNRNPAA